MTNIAILPEPAADGSLLFRAVAGKLQSVGRSAGEALDALAAKLPEKDTGTLVLVQQGKPDRYFSATQQQRLGELVSRWREVRDAGGELSPEIAAELEALVDEEINAAGRRASEIAGMRGA